MSRPPVDKEPPVVRRPLVAGAALGAASRVSVAVTGAATTVAVARLLGADGAGSFAVVLALVYVLVVFTTLGVEHGIAYYVSAGRWDPAAAFMTSQRLALGLGVAGAVGGVVARLVVPAAFGRLTVLECALTAAALPFALSWYYGSFVALADDHYEAYVLPPAAQSAALLVLAIALVIPFGVTGGVCAVLASQFLAAAGSYAWGRRRLRRGHGRAVEPMQLRRALSFGVRGYAANALQVLNYRIDLFILSAVASTQVLGHYAVAVAVTSVLWLLPQALADVVFPRVAALSATGTDDAQRDLVELKSLRHATLVTAVSTVALMLALVLLVEPVYGPEFRDSTVLGLIRLPGVALLGIGGTLAAATVGRGHPEYGLYTAAIVTPVTLVLYAVMIPHWHATGAAAASSLSFTTTFVATALFYRRATGRRVLSRMLPTRSELADYRALWPQARAWAVGILARFSHA